MKAFQAALLLLLMFAAGFVGGVVANRAWTRHTIAAMAANPAALQGRIEWQLIWRLRLNPDQRKQVHEILADSRQRIRGLQQEFQPQIAAIRQETRQKIDAVLTPEQRNRLDQMTKQALPLWLPR